jgi:hypothetical protein
MKLVSIIRSPKEGKKYRATFSDGKHTDFGAEGMDDYTTTKSSDEQKERYRKRHAKDLDTKDPTRAGYLAYYILWNKKSLRESIADYKKMFNM